MFIKTKRLKSWTKDKPEHGVILIFEPDDIRYLNTHLQGTQPKLTWTGTIGQGLTVWFEAKGLGLWETSDGRALEGTIPAHFVAGIEGIRQPVKVNYERATSDHAKPILLLEPLPSFDKDAARAALFNPLLPPPPREDARSAAVLLFKQPVKPELSKADVARVVAKHTNGARTLSETIAALPQPERDAIATRTAELVADEIDPRRAAAVFRGTDSELPVPVVISGGDAIADLKASIEMVNYAIDRCGDDVVFDISQDRRRMKVIRRKVITEEIGA